MLEIRTVHTTRYITPLREGGSMPAIVEADDGFMYVLKFKGAGQGIKSLIAEFIGGEIARTIGLKVPEIVFAELDEAFGRSEPDEEIQDLLKASRGLNLGLHYLSGSVTYEPSMKKMDGLLASKIVWLDAFLANMDRTAKNTNLLLWHNELWLIDHGAGLYYHHNWDSFLQHISNPFALIKHHVLLPQANKLRVVEKDIKQHLSVKKITDIVNTIPAEWFEIMTPGSAGETRKIYTHFLTERFNNSFVFLKEALYE